MKETPGGKVTVRVGRDVTGTVIVGSGNTSVNQRQPKQRTEETGQVQANIAHDNGTIYAVGRGELHVHEAQEPHAPTTPEVTASPVTNTE